MKRFFSRIFHHSLLRNGGLTLGILLLACLSATLLLTLGGNDAAAVSLFAAAVFLIARLTEGYLWGVSGSLIAVILVNYLFTYPYRELNFTITGYPITFLCFLTTSLMTGALTTRIKNQEKLRREAEVEKTRANLLRAISHDLRTPLTSIMGTIGALIENGDRIPAEKQLTLLTESKDEAEWLLHLVENILSVTRFTEGGGPPLHKTPEAGEEVIGETLMKFRRRFPSAEVDVHVPQELLFVPMDALLIEQVLINLLENAVLHGGKNTDISLSLELSPGDDEALFIVRDQGAGIPLARLSTIFSGTLSGEDGRSETRRGMGIGLSVCQSIITAHGGTLKARNLPGGGAEFICALPLEIAGGKPSVR